MIKINGKECDSFKDRALSIYLNEKGYKPGYIAVECNGAILPKSEYDSYIIADGDVIEVVSFVGGG